MPMKRRAVAAYPRTLEHLMHGRTVHRLGLLAAVRALAVAVPPTSAGAAEVAWLCRPGLVDQSCIRSLATTVVGANGQHRLVHPHAARRPGIDCFYLYPTASSQSLRANACNRNK
jgi:hypothetical protein